MDGSTQVGQDAASDATTPPVSEASNASPTLAEVAAVAEDRDLAHEAIAPSTLRVSVASGDVVMAVIPLVSAATGPIAVVAEGADGSSAVVMRDGQELFVIRRNPGVWEHFRAMGGPSAIVGSWRSGERTRFRQRHGALWQAIPAATALAEQLGAAEHLPAETPPPPPAPPVEKKPRARSRAATTRATGPSSPKPVKASKTKAAEPEPTPALCPRCFMQLPLSGRCDCA